MMNMHYEKFIAVTFLLLGITSIMFSLVIVYFVNITALSVEAYVPPEEDTSSLNAVFGAGYLFGILEFVLGIVSLISAYMLLKKRK
jgi:hypothetical protein